MRALILILLGLFVLAGALIATLPLSFALNQAGLAGSGIGWSQARGTIWNGQVLGLTYAGQPAGQADIRLRPLSLLTGQLGYTANWNGPVGRGSGQIALGPSRLKAHDVRAEILLAHVPALDDRIRETGGVLRIRVDELSVRDRQCQQVTGRVTTDAIRLVGEQYRRQWPDLSGELACERGALVIPLMGEGAAGEAFDIRAQINVVEGARLTAIVRGADAEVETVLGLYGFVYEDGAYAYRRASPVIGRVN